MPHCVRRPLVLILPFATVLVACHAGPNASPETAWTSSSAKPEAGSLNAELLDAQTEEADLEGGDSAAPLGPGEHWGPAHRSIDSCTDYRTATAPVSYADPKGPKRKFSYDNYVFRQIEIHRDIDGQQRRHCVDVYWPPSNKNSEGKPAHIAKKIKPSWFRLLERTLARLPWLHLQAVERFVIDNRPLLHGIAPFDRGAPDEDARDGHTIWLDEHLFTDVNHWVKATYGQYWAYHVPSDNVSVDKQRPDHELFSPVLLHEIGHIVNYNIVNRSASDATCPKCAEMCGDLHNCKELKDTQREALCATAYCTGQGHESGTENWAEMYRWYYSGQVTRQLLAVRFPTCFLLLEGNGSEPGLNAGLEAPWLRDLGEVIGYRKTRWDSCRAVACKDY